MCFRYKNHYELVLLQYHKDLISIMLILFTIYLWYAVIIINLKISLLIWQNFMLKVENLSHN